MRVLLIPALCLPLTGCGLDALEGKPSPYKAHVERLAMVSMAISTPVELNETLIRDRQEVLTITPAKQCVVTFRVNRCDEQGNEVEWWYE